MTSNIHPINTQLNAQLIIDVEKVLSKLGLTQQEAILIYYEAIAKSGSLPFDIPNDLTKKVIEDTDNNIDVRFANTTDELFTDLKSDN